MLCKLSCCCCCCFFAPLSVSSIDTDSILFGFYFLLEKSQMTKKSTEWFGYGKKVSSHKCAFWFLSVLLLLLLRHSFAVLRSFLFGPLFCLRLLFDSFCFFPIRFIFDSICHGMNRGWKRKIMNFHERKNTGIKHNLWAQTVNNKQPLQSWCWRWKFSILGFAFSFFSIVMVFAMALQTWKGNASKMDPIDIIKF